MTIKKGKDEPNPIINALKNHKSKDRKKHVPSKEQSLHENSLGNSISRKFSRGTGAQGLRKFLYLLRCPCWSLT